MQRHQNLDTDNKKIEKIDLKKESQKVNLSLEAYAGFFDELYAKYSLANESQQSYAWAFQQFANHIVESRKAIDPDFLTQSVAHQAKVDGHIAKLFSTLFKESAFIATYRNAKDKKEENLFYRCLNSRFKLPVVVDLSNQEDIESELLRIRQNFGDLPIFYKKGDHYYLNGYTNDKGWHDTQFDYTRELEHAKKVSVFAKEAKLASQFLYYFQNNFFHAEALDNKAHDDLALGLLKIKQTNIVFQNQVNQKIATMEGELQKYKNNNKKYMIDDFNAAIETIKTKVDKLEIKSSESTTKTIKYGLVDAVHKLQAAETAYYTKLSFFSSARQKNSSLQPKIRDAKAALVADQDNLRLSQLLEIQDIIKQYKGEKKHAGAFQDDLKVAIDLYKTGDDVKGWAEFEKSHTILKNAETAYHDSRCFSGWSKAHSRLQTCMKKIDGILASKPNQNLRMGGN